MENNLKEENRETNIVKIKEEPEYNKSNIFWPKNKDEIYSKYKQVLELLL